MIDINNTDITNSFIHSLNDGYAIFELEYDSNGNPVDSIVIDANKTYCEYCGVSQNIIPGSKASGFLNELDDQWLTCCSQLVETGVPIKFETYHKPIEKWYEVTANSVNGTKRYVVIIRDITELKKANEMQIRSRKSAEILSQISGKLLVSKSPRRIVKKLCLKVMEFLDCHVFFNYLVDEEKKKLHLNACGGLSEEMEKTFEWLDFGVAVCGCVGRDGKRIVVKNIQQACDPRTDYMKLLGIRAFACHPLKQLDRVIGTLSFGTKSKDSFDEYELYLMKMVANQVSVAMSRILGEKKLREQQDLLLKAEKVKNEALENGIKVKEEFLYTISHEFKTPLTVIIAALQTIENIYTNETSDNTKRQVNRIHMNSLRLLRLVNNLLDITKLSAGYIRKNNRNLDIVFLTREITQSVIPFAKQREIKLNFSSNINNLEMSIDDEKYERILLNLLSNAIKFSPSGKSIYVHIANEKRKVAISVRDEGVGIPKKKQELIFERFGQVDSSFTRQAEGTGIGLSLVKSLISVLGGKLTLESKVNKGSTFTVILPVKKTRQNPLPQNNLGIANNRIYKDLEIEFSDIYL